MKTYALRLKPNEDLRIEIEKLVKEKQIKAGFILTCVGSLKKTNIRLADENITKSFNSKFEIVSLVGTLSINGCHIHISLSDEKGNTIGGHLKEGCIIYSTAEIIIGEDENLIFKRKFDKNTGFEELEISGY